eukprot:2052886-Amphidinium_carterae.1
MAGKYHTCAQVASDDKGWTSGVKCWGSGSLGYEDNVTRGTYWNDRGVSPSTMGDNLQYIEGMENVTSISTGAGFTCVFDGLQTRCWGDGADGKLGYGDTVSRGGRADTMGAQLPAVDLGSNGDVLRLYIGSGSSHACAIMNIDGDRLTTGVLRNGTESMKCWGAAGALGQGDEVARGD